MEWQRLDSVWFGIGHNHSYGLWFYLLHIQERQTSDERWTIQPSRTRGTFFLSSNAEGQIMMTTVILIVVWGSLCLVFGTRHVCFVSYSWSIPTWRIRPLPSFGPYGTRSYPLSRTVGPPSWNMLFFANHSSRNCYSRNCKQRTTPTDRPYHRQRRKQYASTTLIETIFYAGESGSTRNC